MNNSTTININLELQLFDILFILFKFEPQIKDRSARAYIRKNLLRFITNFNFQNRKELLKKLINQVILNLIEYYQNFLLLSINFFARYNHIINSFIILSCSIFYIFTIWIIIFYIFIFIFFII